MTRRTVANITNYLHPNQIYTLITRTGWPYVWNPKRMRCRDRALMATAFVSGGRITPIVGGPRWIVQNDCVQPDCEGLVSRVRVADGFRWICDTCNYDYGSRKPDEVGYLVQDGEYRGLCKKNVEVADTALTIVDMKVAKRTRKLIDKRGAQVTLREPFIVPLERGLFKSEFGDQFVPYGWLILEYLERFLDEAKEDVPLFPFKRRRAHQIVQAVTGKFPNWFRAQSEHFWGHYLWQDSVRLAKFIGVVRPEQVSHYVGAGFDSLLRDVHQSMDFSWIETEVARVKGRM